MITDIRQQLIASKKKKIVMRKDAVYAVILNVVLFHGMKCNFAQDPRYLRFSVIEDGQTIHYNLRVRLSCMQTLRFEG